MKPTLFLAILSLFSQAVAQQGRYRDEVFPQVSLQSDIAYGQAINFFTQRLETLLLDVYEPTGDSASARPAIVLVHGGGFIAGTKTDPNYVQIAHAFARRGYVVTSIDYRLARPPLRGQLTQAVVDATHDMKAAVRWLRANATPLRIDTSRIACLGGSSGAMTCLQAAYADSLGEGTSGNPGFSSKVQALISLWGNMANLTELEAGEAPLQLIHGTKDPILPYQNALDLKARADAVGVYAELLTIQDGSHAEYQAYLQTYQVDSYAFLYQQLALGELAGLAARAGYASPGTLTLDTFGAAGNRYAIALAPKSVLTPVPGIGTLCIGPLQSVVVVAVGTLPPGSRVSEAMWTIRVPPGLVGTSLHWQALHFDASAGLLTNCIETAF